MTRHRGNSTPFSPILPPAFAPKGTAAVTHIQTQPPAAPAKPAPRDPRFYVTCAIMLLMVLASMEQTITATVMPSIIGALHGVEHYAWVPAVYLLAATVTMPLYGRLADAIGRKRVITAAVCLFAGGSLLAALSQNIYQLILFRGIQGLGAGGIMPIVLTILGDIYTLKERAKIQGYFSALWGTASVAGPIVGSILLGTLGWRSIFWVNLPFGLLGLIVLIYYYKDTGHRHKGDLDITGGLTLALGSAALLIFATGIGTPDRNWLVVSIALAIGLTLTIGFFLHERRIAHPIMPPTLLLHPRIGPSLLANLVMGVIVFGIEIYAPLYVQGGRGGSAWDSAATVTPVMLGWAISSLVAARMMVKWGFRRSAMIGGTIMFCGTTGLFLAALFRLPLPFLIATLALTGLGCGPTAFAYLLGAQDAVEYKQRGVVTSLVTFTRTLGGALGVGAVGSLLNFIMRTDMQFLLSHNIPVAKLLDRQAGPDKYQVPPEFLARSQEMIASGTVWVFATLAALTIVQFLFSTRISSHHQSPAAVPPVDAIEAA